MFGPVDQHSQGSFRRLARRLNISTGATHLLGLIERRTESRVPKSKSEKHKDIISDKLT